MWKLSLARPEAWVALLMVLVSVTLCKISSRRFWLKVSKNKTKQKSHDACLEKIKTEYVYIYYIHMPYIKKPM